MLDRDTLKRWFCAEILPLERPLTRYIRRNWSNEAEVADLRQEIYVRVLEGVGERLPLQPKPFLFTTARNHLINRAKRGQVISFESVVELETSAAPDTVTPERTLTAREELRRVQAALERLPPRCREVVLLRKIEGLTQRQVAERLGLSVGTVEQQLVHGMRAVADYMMGGTGKIRRPSAPARKVKAR